MGRFTKDSGGGDFQQAPEGTHIARCYSIIDLGTQHGEYKGEPTAREQIIIRWELPLETTQTTDGEMPLIVSKFYTNSLSEKANLRRDLEAWRGRAFTEEELRGFDLMNILGKPCQVTIVHNDKGKAKVAGVSGMAKGTTCPAAVNAHSAFWIDEWDDNAYASLPEGFKKLIEQSDEFKQLNSRTPLTRGPARAADGVDADDIPF